MEETLAGFVGQLPWLFLAALIVFTLMTLAKGADWLVGEAVALSTRSGIPKVVVGATIVSLGTTTPEAVVSVLAAIQGKAGLALGNAVGSIICDTGLILGLACLIAPLPLDRTVVNRQGRIQAVSACLLVIGCIPWTRPWLVFQTGGALPRPVGILFLGLLALYLWMSVRWSRRDEASRRQLVEEIETLQVDSNASLATVLIKLVASIVVVVASSWVLIPAVSEAATRLSIPESIIAATMVAFGTSLPELVTAVTAARSGHGELAVGNIVGADILNVLFVAGASAAVTSGGLEAPAYFFTLYFPSMLLVLLVFRIGVHVSPTHLKRPVGAVLLATYLVVTVVSYLHP